MSSPATPTRRRSGRPSALAGGLAAAAAVVLALAGCSSSGGKAKAAASGGGAGKGVTIGYSAPFLSAQFEVVLQDQFVAAAKAAGLKVLAPTNANSDSGKQLSDIHDLIAAGAKALIVVANDSKAIIPGLQYAASQHVPVVSIDIGPDGGTLAAIVRADNIKMGEMACTAMTKSIGDSGKVLSLEGDLSSINGNERSKGFRDCIKNDHPNVQLIEQPTGWDATKQANELQTVLTANPDLKGVFQQSDYALSATINILKQTNHNAPVGAPGHVFDISIDGTPQGLGLVRRGVLDAEISQPLDGYVKHGLKYLQDAISGKSIPLGPTDHGTTIVKFDGNPMDSLPPTLVTKQNVDDTTLWGNQAKG
jgi:ribose transport system substrate-binding protein